ncbi:Bacillopeptidase [Lentibacillus sp. JNUCC-1]|uniref:S8 family serine peptidase n=1 Tax=Lentibacillus sp. JNUCC-1 TaxID=2654513 RepID=UPI0012E89E93|nr:cell wall-binding repeat-containing protein [Lentibacillus sp. JNUCC-1]MUV37304.1 Bacillopeptidase [Lentibacillus sp. JNUCC-1]
MIRRKKQWIRYVSSFFIVVLVVGQLMPYVTFAESKSQKENDFKAFIQPELQEAFVEDDFVQYLVILKDQVDTNEIADKTELRAQNQSLSKAEVKVKKQKTVVSSLMEKSKSTQKGLEAYLEKATKNEHVKAFNSYYIVNGFSVTGDVDSMEEIAQFSEVKSVLLDEEKKLILPEEQPDQQKTEKSAAEDVAWNIERMGVPEVWDRGYDGEGVVVANIDSGVDWAHPALKEKYRGYDPDHPDDPNHEFNWHDATSNIGVPVDSNGHGTHTMGTMVGQEPDGSNKIGVAPSAKWITARAFSGGTGNDSDILEAAEWILAPKDENGIPHPEKAPDIVNNSWGGNPIDNDWFRPMVQSWKSVGIVPVFSAGNASLFMGADPGTISSPGNYPESIAVGATDEDDNLASFSLRGPTEGGELKPDVSAPGVNIRSAYPGESWDEYEYKVLNGTSMSAPAVAGTIALMKQADEELTVDAIEDILKVSAVPRTDDEYPDSPNNGYGYGQVDANTVMQAVEEGVGTIKGQIVGEGSDNENPTFDHEPREILFKGEEAYFSIHASDNISVNQVTLTLTSEDGSKKSYKGDRSDGDHLEGSYEVVVPPEDISGSEMDYQWTIADFSGRNVKSEVYTTEVKEGVTTGYSEDFESYPDGWYSFGTFDTWQWGEPVFGPDSVSSGKKVMGTNLDGNYDMDTDMTLMMPPVLVEDGTKLRFQQWYHLAPFGWDVGTVYISTDKENWDALLEIQDENQNWHEVGIDLSDYAGKKVYIGFNLTSLDNERPGWYIDDVKLVNDKTSETEVTEEGETGVSLREGEKSFPITSSQNNDILPLDATVQVEETGWKTKADPQNGEFTIHHKPGEYTLSINAYGYESVTETVSLSSRGTISPEISMKAMQKQTITGKITDQFGNGVDQAQIFLLEDDQIKPVNSAPDGTYKLEAYEGEYTLQVYAKGFYKGSKTITIKPGENLDLNLQLTPFYTNDDSEIKYDNGSYGKNLAMGKKGSGFAVKMSLKEGEEMAMLKGAKLQFWADHVPVPGGDDIVISVYDATGENGSPGNKIAGPYEAKAERDLYSWTEVDLSDKGIVVEGDFYILYTQYADYPYVPGFVADGDKDNATGRSWDYFGGQWFQAEDDVGNYMIRSVVDYGDDAPNLEKPVINKPEFGELTNDASIELAGDATPDSAIEITNNGENIGETEVDSAGQFTLNVDLDEGENKLRAIAVSGGTPVAASDPVSLVLDTKAPELTIDSPDDGETINEDTVLVKGTVSDDHLDWVRVNDEKAEPENGTFEVEVALKEGENKITAEAMDKAGNSSENSITVVYEKGNIGEISPLDDQHVFAGEEVAVSFESNTEGGDASFKIALPAALQSENATDHAMVETKPGFYEGTWNVPEHLHVEGAVIEVQVTSEEGVLATGTAEGRVYVTEETIDRIAGDIRYDTAIEISKKGWDETETVILARGTEYADALAGAPLAHKLDAPILLTPTDELWGAAMEEIDRLGTSKAIILGGSNAVSDNVVSELEDNGLDVERIAGKDRFKTAEKIARRMAPDGAKKVAIVNGMDYPDALTVASHAAESGMPILLAKSEWMAESTVDTITDLDATKSIVVGGTQVIEDELLNELPAPLRLAGQNRYETNIAVNEHFGVDNAHMYVATGREYADALTGAVLAAKDNSTVLLVHEQVPEEVATYIQEQHVKRLSIFGGQNAISKGVFSELKKMLQ